MQDQFIPVATGAASCPICFVDGGNNFASASPTLGNQNNKNLNYITNNITRLTITNGGVFNFTVNSGPYNIANTGATGRLQWPVAFVKEDTSAHGELIGTGDGGTTNFMFTVRHRPIVPGSVIVFVNLVSMGTDNGVGVLTGAGIMSGTINYTTGAIDVTFNAAPGISESVEITDVISGNVFVGTTNTNAFLVVPNDIKIDGDRGLGALFTTTAWNEVVTDRLGSVFPTDSRLGTISFFAKPTAIDPLGMKKLYFVDSDSNEYQVCDTTSGCGAGGVVTNVTGTDPIVSTGGTTPVISCPTCGIDPTKVTTGGIIGGFTNNTASSWSVHGSSRSASLILAAAPTPTGGYVRNETLTTGLITAFVASKTQIVSQVGMIAADVATRNALTVFSPGINTSSSDSSGRFIRVNQGENYNFGNRCTNGTCGTIAGWSAEFVSDNGGSIVGNVTPTGTLTAGTTFYNAPFDSITIAQATELITEFTIPFAATLKNLVIVTDGVQVGTGTCVARVRVNNADSTLSITIPINGVAGVYRNVTDFPTISAFDEVNLARTNNGGTASCSILYWAFEVVPTTPGDFLIGGSSNNPISVAGIFPALFSQSSLAAETTGQNAAPRALTVDLCSATISTAGAAGGTVTWTLQKGMADTAITFTAATNATGQFSDVVNSVAYAKADLWGLAASRVAGGDPTMGTWSCRVR